MVPVNTPTATRSPSPSPSGSASPSPSRTCPTCQSEGKTCDPNACVPSGTEWCANCKDLSGLPVVCSDGTKITLTGCKECKKGKSICKDSGCFIDPLDCPSNTTCQLTDKVHPDCPGNPEQCYCPTTPSSTPSPSGTPSPSPSPSCNCTDSGTYCLNNADDCSVYCRGQIGCSCNPRPHSKCPGQGITCYCAEWSTPSPSPSASPSISCCGVANCCKDASNLINEMARINTASGGCAQCGGGSYQAVADECNPKNCAKTQCFSGASCKNLGATYKTIGVVIKYQGGTRCSTSQGCTASSSPIVGGVCNGTFAPANGTSAPLTC
jgi:hypothetical protein